MNDNAEHSQDETSEAPTLFGSIRGNGLRLGVFALTCTAVIAGTAALTEQRIAEQQRQAQLKALYQIVPADAHDNDLLADQRQLKIEELGHREPRSFYLARRDEQATTLIYPATARDGYSGDIDFIVGINLADGSVAGVRVLQHRETPGLGDKIDARKSDWINDFAGKRLGSPPLEQWTVSKDGGVFDAFTGATITPRAVTVSIANTLRYHHQHIEALLDRFDAAPAGSDK